MEDNLLELYSPIQVEVIDRDISVRQWQELYRAGAFERDDQDARELAGWE